MRLENNSGGVKLERTRTHHLGCSDKLEEVQTSVAVTGAADWTGVTVGGDLDQTRPLSARRLINAPTCVNAWI